MDYPLYLSLLIVQREVAVMGCLMSKVEHYQRKGEKDSKPKPSANPQISGSVLICLCGTDARFQKALNQFHRLNDGYWHH